MCSVRTEGDTALVQLLLSRGIQAQILASRQRRPGGRGRGVRDRGQARVVDRLGSRSLVAIEPSRSLARSERLRRAAEHTRRFRDVVAPPGEPSFAAALDAFVHAARGAPYGGATLEDGYRALRVVEAAEESARSGQSSAVQLDQRT